MEETMIEKLLTSLTRFQAAKYQYYRGLTIVPMLSTQAPNHSYVSLREALQSQQLQISEIGEGGHVPELRVINRGKQTVLILAGEELRGAKQNRVLNTTILVAPESELVVPVSCTEAGRWSYRGREFSESGNVMKPSIKSKLVRSVNASFMTMGQARSDQGEVWDEIDKMQMDHRSASPTAAMADVFESSKPQLEKMLAAFPRLDGQCGIYALLGGRFAGLEMVSLPEVWKELHDKIIHSYAMDAVLLREERPLQDALIPDWEDLLLGARLDVFPGTGLGEDLRIQKALLTGSALLWNDELAQIGLYPNQENRVEQETFHRHRAGRYA